jgi:ribonuclease HI
MPPTIIFTDGSSSLKTNNSRYGGIGIYFPNTPINNISIGYSGSDVTNQRMELLASLKGVEKCIEENLTEDLHIYTDSMYVINCITKWAPKWKQLGWRRDVNGVIKDNLCNLDLIKPLYDYYLEHTLQFTHVRGHQKEPTDNTTDQWFNWKGNTEADRLATKATAGIRESDPSLKILTNF